MTADSNAPGTFYRDRWLNLDPNKLQDYDRMFQWNPASAVFYEAADIQAGQVVAALHPKLLHLALLRGGWRDRSGSRIVRVDPRDGAIEVLFDDPKGELYSAATAAIHGDGLLIMGSAYDSGLLVCEQGLR